MSIVRNGLIQRIPIEIGDSNIGILLRIEPMSLLDRERPEEPEFISGCGNERPKLAGIA